MSGCWPKRSSRRPEQLEREMNAFFAQQPSVGKQGQLALDGKQIRGTAAAPTAAAPTAAAPTAAAPTAAPDAGNEYLLGVYVPGADVMLLQMAIPAGQGELIVAPKVLKALDLQSLP
jgi:hypothetical protein